MRSVKTSVPFRVSRARFWLVLGFVWFAWGVLYATRLAAVKPQASLQQILHYAFSDAVIWALLTPLVLWLGARLPVRAPRIVPMVLLHVVLGLGIGFLQTVLDAVQNSVLESAGRSTTVAEFLGFSLPHRFYGNLMVYGAIVAIGHVVESQRRVSALRADLAEARLKALRLQLQPHFLFNCLNAISTLILTSPRQAREMVGRLAEMLRLALATERDEIPLRDELRLVRSYLDLEHARFGDRLQVREEVADDCLDVLVPAFLLQPIVENAVRHGLVPRTGGGTIQLGVCRRGSRIEMRVTDDGVGIEADARPGIGFAATRARLHERYGNDHRWAVESDGNGTAVAISLPARCQEECA